jgi:Tfp pilus assembly protein PilX
MTRTTIKHHRKRGAAAVLAMLFLVIMTTLTLAMFGLSVGNVQSATNYSDVARAHGAAESGLRWIAMRFVRMQRPRTTVGNINATAMNTLWPQIKQAVIDDMTTGPNRMMDAGERNWSQNTGGVYSPQISIEDGGGTFQLDITQTADPTVLLVKSTGRYRGNVRIASMTFKVDKKVKFAVVGKVPIQIGRNTIVEGPVAMTNAAKFPPILMLSDFTHFDADLKADVEDWFAYLQGSSLIGSEYVPNHEGYDNRISANNPQEYALAQGAGFDDINGDAYIDEYDLFVRRFDANGDKRITESEFTNPSTGKLYDAELFAAMDSIGAPMMAGDDVRVGYQDKVIDNSDGYAKLRGNITMAVTADAWAANLASGSPPKTINDMLQGTVVPTDPTMAPVRFGATTEDMVDLDPANFEECAENFRAQSGSAGGAAINNATEKANLTLTAAMANGGVVLEESPKGSRNFQAVYKRPVFRNLRIKNCIIPKGLNALFDNCTFDGVTFVDDEQTITTASGTSTTSSSEGMNWARRRTSGTGSILTSGDFKDTNADGKWDQYKISGMSAYANITSWDANGQAVLPTGAGSYSYGTGTADLKTKGSTLGNNVRFNNCTFEGPVTGSYATAYTHFANSWEFTGATKFDNKWIDPNSGQTTATVVSPQVNIEMGSFTDPTQAPSTLTGVVVAGNIDIRGSSRVDGCIIITGDGAGNTTLAYFGASDSDTNANANPEGGYGKLNIRYNPTRALPDGILMPVDIAAMQGTYSEVAQ